MSNVGPEGRSFLKIELSDLERLREIAEQDRKLFFKKHPLWAALYKDRVLCITLCQGSAKHYTDNVTGINDFDVWTFYKSNPKKQWCYRRNVAHDFGNPKFGQSVTKPEFVGRRVDCLGRDIPVLKSDSLTTALQRYLHQGKTTTARFLAQKPIILLGPNLGKIIWQPMIGI